MHPPPAPVPDLGLTQPVSHAFITQELDEKDEKQKRAQKKQRRQSQQQRPRQRPPKAAKNRKLFEEIGQALAARLDNFPNLTALTATHDLSSGKSSSSLDTTSPSSSNSSDDTIIGGTSNFLSPDKLASAVSVCRSDASDRSFRSEQAQSCPPMPMNHHTAGAIFTLNDFSAMAALELLLTKYGGVSHMGVLDKSYRFFINNAHTAALFFKIHTKVAIVGGDPLCEPSQYDALLDEFAKYRKKFGWKLAFMGASDVFTQYAKRKRWVTMEFGTDRVLNPVTNAVILEESGKRIVTQSRQLLNPTKGGITLGVYSPSQGEDLELQRELSELYDSWRNERNNSTTTQAFITIYDLFSLPKFMVYIYTRGPDGVINGLAALRRIGVDQGFHIDPYIAAKDAPKGVTDLLIFAAMALLHHAGISYLSLGFEPLDELGPVTGMPQAFGDMTKSIYRRVFPRLHISGKKAYHEKWRPDHHQGSRLYVIFATAGIPGPRTVAAVTHVANFSIWKIVFRGGAKDTKRTTKKDTRKDAQKDVANAAQKTVQKAAQQITQQDAQQDVQKDTPNVTQKIKRKTSREKLLDFYCSLTDLTLESRRNDDKK